MVSGIGTYYLPFKALAYEIGNIAGVVYVGVGKYHYIDKGGVKRKYTALIEIIRGIFFVVTFCFF